MKTGEELFLLDTSILLHLIRDNALGRRIQRSFHLLERSQRPSISVITVGEALAFAKKLGWGTRKIDALESLLHQLVVVPVNADPVLRTYAEVDDLLQRAGKPIGQNDMWIAATAKATKTHLLTTDRDFENLPATYLTWTYIDPKTPD